MGVVFKQKIKEVNNSSSTNHAFTTTADILPGEDIFISINRSATAANTGITNITTSAGAGTFERVATALRASTHDTVLARFRVTTLVPSGSTVTAVLPAAQARCSIILQVVSGLTSAAAHKSSGTASQGTAGTGNGGPNGSGTTASASTSAATTIADTLVLAVMAIGGANVLTPGSGCTLIDEIRTTAGSAERGVQLIYKVVSATGIQTGSATVAPSGSWAAVVAAFEITAPPPAEDPEFKEWDGDSYNVVTPKEWDGDSWNTLTPAEL